MIADLFVLGIGAVLMFGVASIGNVDDAVDEANRDAAEDAQAESMALSFDEVDKTARGRRIETRLSLTPEQAEMFVAATDAAFRPWAKR